MFVPTVWAFEFKGVRLALGSLLICPPQEQTHVVVVQEHKGETAQEAS